MTILILILVILLISMFFLQDEEQKAIYDEKLRKEKGYKWFIGSFENTFRNTIYSVAFIAKNEEELLEKIKKFTASKVWIYDGTIPVAEVPEDKIYRLDNVAIKY